jgi:hypothetical protein
MQCGTAFYNHDNIGSFSYHVFQGLLSLQKFFEI